MFEIEPFGLETETEAVMVLTLRRPLMLSSDSKHCRPKA